MTIIDLQRRQPGPRADELLDGLQAAVAEDERVDWNEIGHTRLRSGVSRGASARHERQDRPPASIMAGPFGHGRVEWFARNG